MSATPAKAPVISLSEGFGAVVVQGPNIKVEIFSDGNVIAHTKGLVKTVAPDEPSMPSGTSTDTHEIGTKMPDGSIYAGVSPDTGRAMYATPKDAPLTCTFNQAGEYAAKLDAHGHRDWRAPTKAELNVLFQNRAAIGNFDTSGSNPAGWYWSSSQYLYLSAWTQRFSDGHRYYYGKNNASSLRCVRR